MILMNRHIVLSALAIILLPMAICAENGYQWGTVTDIDIDTQDGHITKQSDIRVGSTAITMSISGADTEAIITADNSSAAQLKDTDGGATDTLVTEYKLEFDGNGSSESGGTNTEYATYDTFLSGGGVEVKYSNNDYDVVVTIYVRVSNRSDNVADAGVYSATQTLTVMWDGI